MKFQFFQMAIAFLLAGVPVAAQTGPSTLLIVLDGLRPDYVTPELMPNLHAFGEANVVFQDHHSVYPTVTRVNASSLVTGCFPDAHGLMDNAIYFPEVNPDRAISTADYKMLQEAEAKSGGKLLLVPTLGEILAEAGKSLFVASSGSTGSAFLLNHKVKAGAVVHCEMTLPESMHAHVLELLGPTPAEAIPNVAWNARVTDAFLKVGIDEMKAPVSILWYTDPDHTAHPLGIGTPETIAALKNVDMEFGRVLAGLKERGLDAQMNVMVVSDHGFSTGAGRASYDRFVSDFLMEKKADLRNVVRAGYGLYFKEDADKLVPELAMRLQQQEWIGAIFTAPMFSGAPIGVNPGIVSYGAIHYENARSPHLLVSPSWSDEANAHGYKGSTTSMGHGHGSSSPWDIHNTLIAGGPGFKDGLKVALPSGNTDLAPTILKLMGMPKAPTMQGRVLEEAMLGGTDPASVKPTKRTFNAQMSFPEGEGMTYTLEIRESHYGDVVYMDQARAVRAKGQAPAGQFLPIPTGAATPISVPTPSAAPAAPSE
jgi:arylsulfatase A-like enzyme